MPLQYLKLATAVAEMTRAQLLAAMADGAIVVNLKGRFLTVAEVTAHLNGTLDGETVSR